MRSTALLLPILATLVACGMSPDEGHPALAIRCGSLIDGIADEPLGARIVVVRDERIEAVLPPDAPLPPESELLDLGGHTCLPGLIDTHTHLALDYEDSADLSVYYHHTMAQTIATAEDNARRTLEAGFTTVRNVGEYFPDAIMDVRNRIRAGQIPGPRIQTAGSFLTIPGGGGDLVIPGHDESEIPPAVRIGVARGADAFAAAAQTVLDNGADLLKVIASGAVFAYNGVPGAPEMTPDEIAAVVGVARKAGVRVTAHAHGAQSIKEAILAGVDSIEHASLADDEAIRLAAERGVAFSMDIYNGTFTAEVGEALGYPEEFMRKNEETTEAQRVVFEKAYAAGVPILYGTDAGVADHGDNGRQFEVMVGRGMSPMDAIRSATSVAADLMDRADDIGAIEPGRYGDLVAVRGDPLQNIRLLQAIDVVVKGGKVVRGPLPADSKFADAVYHTGRIHTVNPQRPTAQAVAIRGETIVFVGSDDAVRKYIGPTTRVYDLHGRLMLPAFQDAHLHPIKDALAVITCNLTVVETLAGYREKIASCASDNRDAPWVTGSGWLMSVFGPGARTDKAILDELVPDRPAYFESADGHTAWVNSRALAIAGIGRDTLDPEGGVIDRHPETGEPVGSLQEEARYLVRNHIPAPSHEQLAAALGFVRDMLHGYGITSIETGYSYEEYLKTYLEFDDRGSLGLRVRAALRWETTDTLDRVAELVKLRDQYSRGNLSATSVKIFLDGVMENFTALLLDPYLTDSGSRGIPMYDPEHLNDVVTRLDAEGFQVQFHAIGDGAVRQALDAIEAARLVNGDLGHRHQIVHLQLIDPSDIPRFSELDVAANFTPLWGYADDYVTDLTEPFIGPERTWRMYPIRSVRDAGARVAFGSDWSVSSVDPFLQIETAVTRIDPVAHDTPALNPDEALTVSEAIAAFTQGSAWVIGHDDRTGSIEVGKLADLIVLDRNILELDPGEISEAHVILTLFGGRPVHGSPEALATGP